MTSYKTFLMYDESNSKEFEKLIDIKNFPDLGGAPEMLDKTTLSDKMRVYEPGIQDTSALEFDGNYTMEEYDKLKALEGKELSLSVWFGGTEAGGKVTPTGDKGKYDFKGMISVYIVGAAVNEIVNMRISIAPTTVIDKHADA